MQSESASTGRISYNEYSRENFLLFLDIVIVLFLTFILIGLSTLGSLGMSREKIHLVCTAYTV